MAAKQDLTINKGDTFSRLLRWEAPPIVYKPITNILREAPAKITATAHGIPDGWRAAIVSVKGMTQINAKNTPPKDSDYSKVTYVDDNTVTINTINAAEYSAYLSGGYLQYNTPVNMTGFTARMLVKDRVGGTELFRLTTENNRIAIDNANKTITLYIPAADTEGITWTKGVYDLEMVSAAGVVTKLLRGTISVVDEVTTAII